MRAVHILFFTDNFPPETNAPASRTFEHARLWTRAGEQVTVVTCAPNFPAGKVFPGYRNRLFQREVMEGIEVRRVWSYITANEGFLKRSLDYASYMASASLAAPFVRKVDVVVATSPQFFTACAGALAARMLRRPFVFELRDLWPESIRAVGAMANERVLGALERLELFLYRQAEAVVSVTESFRRNLISRGVDGDKVHVVTNGADLGLFAPRGRDEALAERLGLSGAFVVGYVGTHGMAHALETVLTAAARLGADPATAHVRFLFLGDGAAKKSLKAEAEAAGLTNVLFLDSVPRAEVGRYWSLLDASVIHLRRADLFETVIPSKLFECMAMGVPVLHGVRGESAAIVEREGVGLVFEPEDPAALCEAVTALAGRPELRQRLSGRGPEAAVRYDRTALADRMLGVLRAAAGQTPFTPELAA